MEHQNGEKLTRTEQADVIKDKLGLKVSEGFITNLHSQQATILERVHMCDDDLKAMKKDRL